MNIYALQTARKDSKSVLNKNILEIEGKPLWKWNFDYANSVRDIKATFISTDIPEILDETNFCIPRPKHMCNDDSSHYETILHGLFTIENRIQDKVDILVILLGNNRGAYPSDLQKGINELVHFPISWDSAISVGKYNMFNPYRAYKNNKGRLNTYIPQENYPDINNLNNKDAYGDVYFFNGSFWICKREAIINNNGLKPFTWLGKHIYSVEQDSKIMELDAPWQTSII